MFEDCIAFRRIYSHFIAFFVLHALLSNGVRLFFYPITLYPASSSLCYSMSNPKTRFSFASSRDETSVYREATDKSQRESPCDYANSSVNTRGRFSVFLALSKHRCLLNLFDRSHDGKVADEYRRAQLSANIRADVRVI